MEDSTVGDLCGKDAGFRMRVSDVPAYAEPFTERTGRVYIAGPMTGYPDYNFPAFRRAAMVWRSEGWVVINPADAFDGDTSRPYADYMRKDIADLLTVEAVAFLPGWERSRGAQLEHSIATALGLTLYDAETFGALPTGPRAA
jgi:hypothetical protein